MQRLFNEDPGNYILPNEPVKKAERSIVLMTVEETPFFTVQFNILPDKVFLYMKVVNIT